ncbi:hypothetical protein DFP73DRAFT_526955 [Morchella snyderi]|nr:hypothetical protein DFP73DRAFT_526955 [Morchella snyderi]
MSVDLESQRSSISSYHDELSKKEAGILTNVEELKDESAEIKTLLDGAAHRTSKKWFLAWATVFTNKRIFQHPSFAASQTSFASFHFLFTTLTLLLLSRPPLSLFTPSRTPLTTILPLALAICLNVILPNLSLAHSSIPFYQTVRILLTPLVALLNLALYHTTIPIPAALALIPVCAGVALTSYSDTHTAHPTRTSPAGAAYAFTGVLASALYTVWIGSYHRRLGLSSMQLLLNQAPVAGMLLAACAPLVDNVPAVVVEVEVAMWWLVLLSGALASVVNLSQFYVVREAGAVGSTVVGHVKTCVIVMMGWWVAGGVEAGSVVGVGVAMGGVAAYSWVVGRSSGTQVQPIRYNNRSM